MHIGCEDAGGQYRLPLILGVLPDPLEACALRDALGERVQADVLFVVSTEEAFAVIDKRIPEIVLLHAFMPPSEEEHFIAYLSTVPGAEHVQTISIPHLLQSPVRDRPKGLLGRSRWHRSMVGPLGCDPRMFAADVLGYLTLARAVGADIEGRKAEDEHAPERRGGHRWSPSDVPWMSAVRLSAGEVADLVNLSSTGTLIRTHIRPALASLKRLEVDHRPPSGLTFHLASGEQIRAAGRVVRCRPRPMGKRHILYEVAFRFDQSLGLDLADAALFTVGPGSVDRTPPSQNEVLRGSASGLALPSSSRDAAAELSRINAALLGIRSTMRGARGAQLLDLAKVHGARVRELDVMRRKLGECLAQGDRLQMTAQLS
jgi:hypothetical protein